MPGTVCERVLGLGNMQAYWQGTAIRMRIDKCNKVNIYRKVYVWCHGDDWEHECGGRKDLNRTEREILPGSEKAIAQE